MTALSVIEIGIDPTIELGPVTLAWHGITIALGMVIGGPATARHARELGSKVIEASAGSFVYGPRDVPHTFAVDSDVARFPTRRPARGFRALRAGGRRAGTGTDHPAAPRPAA